MKTTLYSLNLVQLDLSEHPPFWRLIPLLAGAVQMAIDHWLLEQHKLGLFPPILRFYWVTTGNFVGLSSIQLA